jgi:hypothetical protein
MKKYVFFFHYHKPASRRTGVPTLSLHWRGQCHLVHTLTCFVLTRSKTRKKQPFIVIEGRAHTVSITDGHANILG